MSAGAPSILNAERAMAALFCLDDATAACAPSPCVRGMARSSRGGRRSTIVSLQRCVQAVARAPGGRIGSRRHGVGSEDAAIVAAGSAIPAARGSVIV